MRTDATRSSAFDAIIGEDPTLRATLARAALVAPTGVPVLVTGESGTGKELIARVLHELGPNPGGPFVAVNCGALPRELAESELFGHERGAFTGAAVRRVGSLAVGEIAVAITAASAHRAPAFEACRAAIDRLKERAPIWKKEIGPGGEAWLGLGP